MSRTDKLFAASLGCLVLLSAELFFSFSDKVFSVRFGNDNPPLVIYLTALAILGIGLGLVSIFDPKLSGLKALFRVLAVCVNIAVAALIYWKLQWFPFAP